MKINERVKYLLDRYQADKASEVEFDELLIWMHGLSEAEEAELAIYYAPLWENAKLGLFKSDNVDWPKMQETVLNSDDVAVPLERNKVKKLWWKFAAAATLILGIGLTYWLTRPSSTTNGPDTPIVKQEVRSPDKVLPNSKMTTLTLADGRVIVLDSAGTGELVSEGDVKVIKLQNGEIAYNSGNVTSREPQMHTIAVPRGGRPYQLLLADGTKVWLNAESSLNYPEFFAGDSRKVSITGEAYFEVAHNSAMPFNVAHNGLSVQVLGTHFNVNTYEDEKDMRVTLLEGSVKVNDAVIKPGQQGIVSSGAPAVRVAAANTNLATAWMKGYFQFDKADVKTILRQVGRWYNLEVEYRGNVSSDLFSGKMERDIPLSGIVNFLSTGNMELKVIGNKLIVE